MRRTATATQARPVWSPALATVVGSDARGRGDIVRLLGDAGFGLQGELESTALVVLLGPAREDAGLRTIRTIAESHPNASILAIMPADLSNAALRRVLLAGAAGIVLEDDVERALVPTAHALLAGQLAVPVVLGQQIAPRPLSHREKQILSMLLLGLTNRQIAGKLFLAESTIKTHLASAFRKIDAHSRSEAVARIQDPESGIRLGVLAVANGTTR
jgi:DNA-binding NarL/FixJ family response regulator